MIAALSCDMQVQRQLPTLPEGGLPALLGKVVDCMRAAAARTLAAVPPLAVCLAALVVQWQDCEGALHTLGAPALCLLMLSSCFLQPAHAIDVC
jgi:hypothetical protein